MQQKAGMQRDLMLQEIFKTRRWGRETGDHPYTPVMQVTEGDIEAWVKENKSGSSYLGKRMLNVLLMVFSLN